MPNDTVESAPSQPAEAAQAPEARDDARKKGNLSVAQAAQRLLNMEAENAKAQRQVEQVAPAPDPAPSDSTNPEAANAESAEPSQQAETPEGEADVPSQDNSAEDDKIDKKIEKRIGKEIAKRRAVEAQLAEAQAKLAERQAAEQPQPAPAQPLPSNVPLAQIEDFQSLQTLRDQAKEAKRFAQEQLDRDDFEPVRVGDTVLGKSELKAILRNAEKTLDDDIPSRAQFLTQKQEAQKLAHQMFPYLKNKEAPEYVLAQQALQQMPWMRNLPNADWIIGVQIEGLKALEAKQKAKPDAKPKQAMSTKPPSSQSVVSSAGGDVRTPSAAKTANQLETMRMQLSKKGGVTANEAAAFLLAREKAKLNR